MRAASSWRDVRIYTVGHSTRTLDELIALLRTFGVSTVADIRTIPRSRHNPQFERETLRSALRRQRLGYRHLPALGGLRRARRDTPNTGWRNASFRGYADHMLTEEFGAGLAELRELAARGTVALMCAEAVPWRCHRSLVADALTVRGADVEHITSAKRATPHHLTEFAHVDGLRITYPADGGSFVATQAPFHLEATVRVLQRRPTNLVDVWDEGRYLRVFELRDGLALIEARNQGTIDQPELRFRVLEGDDSRPAHLMISEVVQRVLGLQLDPQPWQRLLEAERRLGPVAFALRGMRPPRFPTLFETFANVIPFQQVSLDAGVAIVRRLVARFGRSLLHAGQKRYAFPTAAALAQARLDTIRACGLSARKAETLRRVAKAIAAGDLTEAELSQLGSVEAMRSLTALHGIGNWSAGLILLRGLGRLDVFPQGDVGVIRGLTHLLQIQPGPALERVVRRFGEQCGYLYFCSLGGALLAKGLIHPAAPKPEALRSRKTRS